MEHLVGTYECKADAKGRIMMPVAIKKQLSATLAEGFDKLGASPMPPMNLLLDEQQITDVLAYLLTLKK